MFVAAEDRPQAALTPTPNPAPSPARGNSMNCRVHRPIGWPAAIEV